MIDPEEIHPNDIAPDADDNGDDLPEELAAFVHDPEYGLVSDEVDQPDTQKGKS